MKKRDINKDNRERERERERERGEMRQRERKRYSEFAKKMHLHTHRASFHRIFSLFLCTKIASKITGGGGDVKHLL